MDLLGAEYGGVVGLSDHATGRGNDIARFKALTDEQKAVLLSASKLSGCYTEGVVLFRAVPPSLYLALGMTEKGDDRERREGRATRADTGVWLQRKLEAARRVAQKLDRLRAWR